MEPNQFNTGISSSPIPPKRGILKTILWVFGIIVALVFVAGGIVTFFVLRADPEKVILQMMEGISTIETLEADQEFVLDFKPKEPIKNPVADMYPGLPKEIKSVSLKMLMHQASEIAPSRFLESKNIIEADTAISINGERLANVILEYRTLDKHIYSRLKRLEVDLIGLAVEQTKWLDIDTKNKIIAQMLRESEITDEQAGKIRKLTLQTRFIKIKEDKGIEWKGYVPTHHYVFSVDSKAVLNYLVNVEKIMGAGSVVGSASLSTEVQKTIDEIISEGDLWVTVFGQMPYSIRVPFSLDSVTSVLALLDPSLAGSSLKAVFSMTASGINKPIKVGAPEKTIPLDQFLEMATSRLNNARSLGQVASVKSSLSNMRTQAELYYASNGNKYARKAYPLGACPIFANGNDSLFTDKNMQTLLSTISSLVGQNKPVCMASANAWVTAVEMPPALKMQNNGADVLCADSKGSMSSYNYTDPKETVLDTIDKKKIACVVL